MNQNNTITIGSRGSKLALWQANHVKNRLEDAGYLVKIEIIKTQGDLIQNLSFDKLEGKGFFTKEIENALLDGRVDLAVHSLKDLETDQPEGLSIAATSERNSPFDVLLIKEEFYNKKAKWGLPENAVVGTSSARRKAWLKGGRVDVLTEDLRGNVPTRIDKLRTGPMHAIVLAEAGLNRIGSDLSGLVKIVLPHDEFVPAPAQGVLGLQTRIGDERSINAAQVLNDKVSALSSSIERAVLNGVGGGCHVPFGAYCIVESEETVNLEVAYNPEEGLPIRLNLDGRPDYVIERALDQLKKKSL